MEKIVKNQLPSSLEARPIAMLVQVASQYKSKIMVETGSKQINAKSIMGMMSLGLDIGEKVNVIVDGADESAALDGIEKYLSGK